MICSGFVAYWYCHVIPAVLRILPPRFSAVSLVCVLSGWPLVGGWALLWLAPLLFVWVGEVGPGPEPWTGLHCSELHWR